MKYLLLFGLLLLVYLLWRKAGRRNRPESRAGGPVSASALDMVRCPVCLVHLPQADAVPGRLASYCSAEHRDQRES